MWERYSGEIGPLRRAVYAHDPLLAMHSQLHDYFMTSSPEFGILMNPRYPDTFVLFSQKDSGAFIHAWLGNDYDYDSLIPHFNRPIQMYVREGQPMPESSSGWVCALKVTPGFVTDHPAYDGVFSRTAPRFHGAVYEHS